MPLLETITAMGSSVLPVLAGLGGLVSGSKFVQEGQRGVKLRFGKVVRKGADPKIIRPGFVFVIPAIEHLHKTHVRTRTLNLPRQEVILSDSLVFVVSGMVQFRVRDTPDAVYSALFETFGLNDTVIDYVSRQLRDVVSEQSHETAPNRELISRIVSERITEQLSEWGVELIDFGLTDCSPTSQSARAILIRVETMMRAEALRKCGPDLVGEAVRHMPPAVAAALIGTPVVTSLDNTRADADYYEDDPDE